MLTVKVKRRSNDGLSLDRNTTISAIEVVTDYMHQPDDSVLYTVDVVNYKGTVHSFELMEGTIIYVENLAGKTVDVYRYTPPLKEVSN